MANESELPVWFDDFTITYTPALVVQENHYDPWGLNLAGIEKEGDYLYQYNSASEKQEDLLEQGYFYETDQTDLRGYDPQLGRFRAVDVLADQMSGITPYQFSFNNPVMFSDPRGDMPSPLIGAVIGGAVGGVIGGLVSKQNGGSFWSGFAVGATIGAGIGAGAGYALDKMASSQTASWQAAHATRSGELGWGTRGVQGADVASVAGGGAEIGVLDPLVGRAAAGAGSWSQQFLQQTIPVLFVLEVEMPQTYAHIRDAQSAGYPRLLTRDDPALNNKKRDKALKFIPTFPGFYRDEYPFASTVEHNLQPSVRHVPDWEQWLQGGQLSVFYGTNNIQTGDQFYVQPIPRGGLAPQMVPPGVQVPKQYLQPAPVRANPQPSFLEKIIKWLWPVIRQNPVLRTQK